MTRVKRGTTKLKRRRNVLAQTKGYRFGRSTKERQAREAIFHAGVYAFAHRRQKKSEFRKLWQTQIGAGLREFKISYSRFIDAMHKKDIALDRKILADLAEHEPKTFARVVEQVTAK